MSEKKHELLLIFAALLICCFFLMYEIFDSPKYNKVEAFPISSSEYLTSEASAASGTVNINSACVQELCTLEGIGEAKAKAIVEYREKNGDFRAPEEIMQVNGISEKIFKKNINRITV